MKRTAASLSDTPTGRPRRALPRWAKNTFTVLGVLLVGRTVQGLWLPSLTPEQVASLDADARYTRWKASPEGAGFERLRVAAATLIPDDRAIGNCYSALLIHREKPASPTEVWEARFEARQLLQKYQAALQTMRQSVDQPFALSPWRSTDELAPYLADFRRMARLNALSAEIKQRDGDADGAADDLVAGMEFGKHLMPGGNIIGRLVGISCQAIAVRPLWQVLPDISPTAYRRLLPRLVRAGDVPPVADALEEEKRFGQRMLMQIFGDKRFGKGYEVNPAYAVTTVVWPRRTVFNGYTDYLEGWKAISNRPYQSGEKSPTEPSDWLNLILLPVFDNTRFKDVQERAGNALILQAAAVHAFRAERGYFPQTLDETAPRYLPTLPGDPFGQNKPLRYRPDGDTFTLYSVGPDGKDDGGQAVTPTQKTSGKPTIFVEPQSIGDMVGGVVF